MDQQLKTMIGNMPEKTGKSLEEWKQILSSKSFQKHSEALNYLKKEHGVSHGFANTIVHLSKEDSAHEPDLVQAQYSGKENLLPIYESILGRVKGLGTDVTIAPKKGSVSVIRKRQFALIKPATKTRVDLGLKLKGVPNQGRLEGSGPFGTMCSHRIQISALEEVDNEVLQWLEAAYQASV